MSIPPQSGARGLERYGLNIKLYRNGKYAFFQKKVQIKVFRHRISDKNVCEGICLISPGVELGTSKDDIVEKYIHFFQP